MSNLGSLSIGMGKRRIKKVLQEKYNLSTSTAFFKLFPDRKPERRHHYAVFSLPPPLTFDREIQEVKSIVESFKPNAVPPQDALKSLFRREDGWRPDYRFFPQEGLWSFDAYKNRVAIEVLGENLDEVFKDCFKFLLAFKARKVRFGVIVVPHAKRSSKSPDAVSVDAILHRFSPVLQDYGLWILRASYSVQHHEGNSKQQL